MRGKQKSILTLLFYRRITPACAGKTASRTVYRHSQADHPRVCGENSKIQFCFFLVYWITPACAGKTQLFRINHALPSDHPRVCGENTARPSSAHQPNGSPPRVRGKRSTGTFTASFGRITPACAGKTRAGAEPAVAAADHPRVCGENRLSTS